MDSFWCSKKLTSQIVLYGCCTLVVGVTVWKLYKNLWKKLPPMDTKTRQPRRVSENDNNLSVLKNIVKNWNNEKSLAERITEITIHTSDSNHSKQDINKLHIIYASQTNTGAKFARSTRRTLQLNNIFCELFDASNYSFNDWIELDSNILILILSTTGAGDAPDSGIGMEKWLENAYKRNSNSITLRNLNYCIFGLGDRNYDHFNAFARRIDKMMRQLGARNILTRVDSDASADQEATFIEWKNKLMTKIENDYTITSNQVLSLIEYEYSLEVCKNNLPEKIYTGEIFKYGSLNNQRKPYNMKNPLLARVVSFENCFDSKISSRCCFHVELSIENSSIRYSPGDHLGIYPTNDTLMVKRLTELLDVDLDQVIDMVSNDENMPTKKPFPCPTTLHSAFTHYLDIGQPVSRDLLIDLIPYISDLEHRQLIEYATSSSCYEIYKKYFIECHITLKDLLEEIPSLKPPLNLIVESLPRLCCRYYSIASSPLKYPHTVHIDALTVDFTIEQTQKHYRGVCTNYLSDKDVGSNVAIFIRKNPAFHLPTNINTKMIWIGIGTGIAPYVGFLQHRMELLKNNTNENKVGQVVLFYGCRSKHSEFLYAKELDYFVKENILSDLFVAFSRDQDEKIYVNHLIEQQGALVWDLIQKNACIYLCGDAAKLSYVLNFTIHRVMMKFGNLDDSQASSLIQSLKDKRLIKSDIWK